MRVGTFKLVLLLAVVFFLALFTGKFAAAADFEVPLRQIEIPNTVERGDLKYTTKRVNLNEVNVLFFWTSPIVFQPGVVTVQCRAFGTEGPVHAAYSWLIVPGSINNHFGMLSMQVPECEAETQAVLGRVACHWGFEGPSVPADKNTEVNADSQF
jgi:hypothetical protein